MIIISLDYIEEVLSQSPEEVHISFEHLIGDGLLLITALFQGETFTETTSIDRLLKGNYPKLQEEFSIVKKLE